MKFSVLFAVCVLVKIRTYDASVDPCSSAPAETCPLFNTKSDLVSVQDLMDQNMTSDGWFLIYGSDFGSQHGHGKCNYKWTPSDSDNVIRRQAVCYNFNLSRCESFDDKMTWIDAECGRVKETAVDNTESGTFYSQDVGQYLVYHSCYNFTSPDTCDIEYLDIILRDYRYRDSPDKELDLQGMPWHLLAADLKNNNFTSQEIEFHWKGPECGFDGKVITKVTNAAPRSGIDFVLMFIVMVMMCNF